MKTSDCIRLRSRRHALIAIVCAVLLLSVLVSSAYIAHEAACRHSCVGEDCPVCRFIVQVGQLRRGFGLALLVLIAAGFALLAHRAAFARAMGAGVPALYTPVGRKIRLND